MGVFLYSTKHVNTERVINVFKTRGHENIKDHSNDSYSLVTAPKTLVKNVNYIGSETLGGQISLLA